mmetsp:Transcript_76405/g.182995  ORF Transcript_76405/g.182995 Transcript_76405/m.182995 type:complete len:315 (+) Transcript_76405:1357-2301(+)
MISISTELAVLVLGFFAFELQLTNLLLQPEKRALRDAVPRSTAICAPKRCGLCACRGFHSSRPFHFDDEGYLLLHYNFHWLLNRFLSRTICIHVQQLHFPLSSHSTLRLVDIWLRDLVIFLTECLKQCSQSLCCWSFGRFSRTFAGFLAGFPGAWLWRIECRLQVFRRRACAQSAKAVAAFTRQYSECSVAPRSRAHVIFATCLAATLSTIANMRSLFAPSVSSEAEPRPFNIGNGCWVGFAMQKATRKPLVARRAKVVLNFRLSLLSFDTLLFRACRSAQQDRSSCTSIASATFRVRARVSSIGRRLRLGETL